MQRVVILGRGAAGKSRLARALGAITRLPVIELDKLFWQQGLLPTPPETWAAVQERLAGQEQWIMDGDLGPYDAVQVRLRRADTAVSARTSGVGSSPIGAPICRSCAKRLRSTLRRPRS